MKNTGKIPYTPLFRKHEEPQNYEIFIFGTVDRAKKKKDTFSSALKRYMDENNVSRVKLADWTGIAISSLSRYLSGKRHMDHNFLCAICIALRLHPSRQRYLFRIMKYQMPDEHGFTEHRNSVIRAYLDGCAFDTRYNLIACNEHLVSIGELPLTNVISERRTLR